MSVTREINSIIEIASDYDAIVFDQWGVLHDGAQPYSFAVQTLRQLNLSGHCLAVLSNSGKRASKAQKVCSPIFLRYIICVSIHILRVT